MQTFASPRADEYQRPQPAQYRPRALVADIGGTNMRFAVSDLDALSIANYALFKNDMFGSPLDALRAYLKSTPERPDHVGIAVAGPVDGDHARLTNRPWTLSAREIMEVYGARNVHFEDHLENGKMIFDYKLREGVVSKSNALELMRSVGLEV